MSFDAHWPRIFTRAGSCPLRFCRNSKSPEESETNAATSPDACKKNITDTKIYRSVGKKTLLFSKDNCFFMEARLDSVNPFRVGLTPPLFFFRVCNLEADWSLIAFFVSYNLARWRRLGGRIFCRIKYPWHLLEWFDILARLQRCSSFAWIWCGALFVQVMLLHKVKWDEITRRLVKLLFWHRAEALWIS